VSWWSVRCVFRDGTSYEERVTLWSAWSTWGSRRPPSSPRVGVVGLPPVTYGHDTDRPRVATLVDDPVTCSRQSATSSSRSARRLRCRVAVHGTVDGDDLAVRSAAQCQHLRAVSVERLPCGGRPHGLYCDAPRFRAWRDDGRQCLPDRQGRPHSRTPTPRGSTRNSVGHLRLQLPGSVRHRRGSGPLPELGRGHSRAA
jgi:hypothetical protein